MAVSLDHIGIVAAGPAELAELTEFFGEVLGCDIAGDPLEGYAEAKLGGVTIALHAGARTEVGRPGGTLLHLTCPDVDAEIAAIRGRGGVIAAPPEDLPWGRSAYVAGPLGVMTEIYRPSQS